MHAVDQFTPAPVATEYRPAPAIERPSRQKNMIVKWAWNLWFSCWFCLNMTSNCMLILILSPVFVSVPLVVFVGDEVGAVLGGIEASEFVADNQVDTKCRRRNDIFSELGISAASARLPIHRHANLLAYRDQVGMIQGYIYFSKYAVVLQHTVPQKKH